MLVPISFIQVALHTATHQPNGFYRPFGLSPGAPTPCSMFNEPFLTGSVVISTFRFPRFYGYSLLALALVCLARYEPNPPTFFRRSRTRNVNLHYVVFGKRFGVLTMPCQFNKLQNHLDRLQISQATVSHRP